MFSFFSSFGKKSFLGVDFGTSSIKVVELSLKSQKPYLENYGWASFNMVSQKDANNSSPGDLFKLSLLKILEKIKPKAKSAYVSIPGFTGLITIFDFPYMEKNELEQAVKFEIHKYIPTSVEEVAVSWDVIGTDLAGGIPGKKPSRVQILLVAATKEEIVKYENIVKGAGLRVDAVELETFSLVRSLVGDDPGTYLIIDIGYRACNIILAEKGIIKVNRNLDTGGNEITSSLAENFNISWQRAEDMKKQGKDFINDKLSPIIVYPLEMITSESKRIIEAYKGKNFGGKIDNIIISGGTAKLKGIEDYFTRTIGIPSVVGDPWKRILVKEGAKDSVGKVGSFFSVAAGLALRGLDDYKRS